MTIDTKDYTSYLKENEQLLREMEGRSSAVFSYLLDALIVNNYIVTMFSGVENVPADLAHYKVIFEETVGYFHDSFEMYKTLYKNYFKNDPLLITPYESLIVHALYLDDIMTCLSEQGKLTPERQRRLKKTADDIDEILREHLPLADDYATHFTADVAPCLPKGFQTTGEIIARIADEVDD